ncbi:MAG: hypothetical protein RR069_00810, partial [Oscillospiraceae bacterium]
MDLFPKCFQCINVEHRSHTRVCSLAQNLELIAFQKNLSFRAGNLFRNASSASMLSIGHIHEYA